MVQQIQQVREVDRDGLSATRTTTTIDNVPPANTREVDATSTVARIIWYIASVLLVLLAFRFVLILLGANEVNAFVNFVYALSYPFAAPFFGLFSYNLHYGISQFELSTIVAMIVYALIAYGIVRLITIRRPAIG